VAAEAGFSSTFQPGRADARPVDTVLRRLGRALACALLASLGLAPAARAAQLVEIRVGVHPGFTRVVFELDSQAGYSVARPSAQSASDELVVDLAARSLRRVVTSRSDLVDTVRIEPGERGSVARIHLRGAVDVSDTLLLDPPRIVIDLRRPAPRLAAAEGKPSTGEAETEARPAPTTETAAEAETAAPSTPESEAPRAMTEAGEAPAAEPSEVGETATAETPAQAPSSSEAPEPSPVPEQTPVLDERAQELAGGETPPAEASPATPPTGLQRPRTARAMEPGQAAKPAPAAPGSPGARPEVASPGGSGVGLLQDPRVLAVGAVALVLLVVFLGLRRRRRSSARPPLADFPPYEEEAGEAEEPVVVARSEEDLGGLAVPRAEELGGEGPPAPLSARSSLYEPGFDVEPADDELGAEHGFEPGPEPGPESQLAGSAGLRAGPGPDRRVEELERRVTDLEKRLEEVAEVKDRLDRQLATQNEELRVQRAAIARTQRVLRNLSQNPDSATEPALKGPGSQPPGSAR
jgi:hypothetical protein